MTVTLPIKVEHPLVMEPGVYFGLDDDVYHGALALSASGIRHMRVSSMNFWASSPLNPDLEERDTEALKVGRIYDKRIIEGKSAFYDLYAPALDPNAHPDALDTVKDIKAKLAEIGAPTKGLSGLLKADLVTKLLDYEPGAKIWDVLVAQHAEQYPNREFVPFKLVRQVELAAAMIENDPELRRAFSGGMPQTSVFWVDEATGVPCKARFDYLKPLAVVDLKTFQNVNQLPVEQAAANAIANYRYNVQAAFYLRGAAAARRLAAEGKVAVASGDGHDGLVRTLADPQLISARFLFVFQQKGVAPVAFGYWFDEGPAMDSARMDINSALAKFAECWSVHGDSTPWVYRRPIESIDHYSFPAYLATA